MPADLEKEARALFDDDDFVTEVAQILNDYQASFAKSKAEDSLTRTEMAKQIQGYITALRAFEKQRLDTTAKMLALFNTPSEKQCVALYRQGTRFDDVAQLLLGLSVSDLDAKVANLCTELEGNLAADKRFRKAREIPNTKAVTVGRRDDLLVPLMRVFHKHSLSTSIYPDDGMGNPSKLVVLAVKVATAAEDKTSAATLGSIEIPRDFLPEPNKISPVHLQKKKI